MGEEVELLVKAAEQVLGIPNRCQKFLTVVTKMNVRCQLGTGEDWPNIPNIMLLIGI